MPKPTAAENKEVPYEVVCLLCNDQVLRFWDLERDNMFELPGYHNTNFVTQVVHNHAIRKHDNMKEDDVRFIIQRELKKRPRKPKWKMARRESILA